VVGISGGPDSVALVSLLVEAGYKPILGHVNYHLRGAASNADQKLVEKLAKQNKLKLEILSAHPKKMSGNLENNCRKLRYEFFEKLRSKHKATATVVAHNLDDQIETFLLNLTRGARLRGFQAMKEWDPDRRLFRPLLGIEKKDLLKYLRTEKINFRKDSSNKNLKFSRNFIRHKIIPLFQKLNPNFQQTLSSTIENLSSNWEIIDQETEFWIKENFQRNAFQLKSFLDQPVGLQNQIISRLSAVPLLVPDRNDHIEAAALRNKCRRSGVQIGTIDALLARLCIRHDLTMLTTDNDFVRIAERSDLRLWGRP